MRVKSIMVGRSGQSACIVLAAAVALLGATRARREGLLKAAPRSGTMDTVTCFNAAYSDFRAGRQERAESGWANLSKQDCRCEVKALAAYNAGNAAFGRKRFAEAVALYREALRQLDTIVSPSWPGNLPIEARRKLLSGLRNDLLFNLELAGRMLGKTSDKPDTKNGADGSGKAEGKSPGKGAPDSPSTSRDKGGKSPLPPAEMPAQLSPQETARLLRAVVSRDVPPPPRPRASHPTKSGPDW